MLLHIKIILKLSKMHLESAPTVKIFQAPPRPFSYRKDTKVFCTKTTVAGSCYYLNFFVVSWRRSNLKSKPLPYEIHSDNYFSINCKSNFRTVLFTN